MTNANGLVHSFNHTADTEGNFNGLTKREYFAAMAMQGLLSNTIYHNPNEKHKMITVSALTKVATDYADALINALNKTK